MIFFYKTFINIILILSPLIILIRLLKKKEDFIRFKEKYSFFSKNRTNGKLIWFHGASVGEFQSIVPLLEKLEKSLKNEIELYKGQTFYAKYGNLPLFSILSVILMCIIAVNIKVSHFTLRR